MLRYVSDPLIRDLKIHRFCLPVQVGQCLPCTYRNVSHDFPDMIMTLPFYLVAYPFLWDKRQSTHFMATCVGNLPVPVHGNGVPPLTCKMYESGSPPVDSHPLLTSFNL